MKGSKVGFYVLFMALVGVGVAMFVTNPKSEAYDEFAAQRLTAYLKENVCQKADALKDTCDSLLKDKQQEIKAFISENTQREDFGILSVYKTDLSLDRYIPPFLGNMLPDYHFETVGVFSGFYLYKQEEKK